MSELVILVPVLQRPRNVKPLLESVRSTTPGARVLFIPDPADAGEIEALDRADAEWIAIDGNYAHKIRGGVQWSTAPLIFTGADDLCFQPDWFEAAKAHLKDGIQVVGVNDLIRRRRLQHATHFLMTRRYAETPTIDGQPGPFSDEYFHWRCDDELAATARKRGVYVYAEDAHVRHVHPMMGLAPDDDTYRLGRSRARADNNIFQRRQRLWAA